MDHKDYTSKQLREIIIANFEKIEGKIIKQSDIRKLNLEENNVNFFNHNYIIDYKLTKTPHSYCMIVNSNLILEWEVNINDLPKKVLVYICKKFRL